MADVDPDTLLEWLVTGHGDERDMQLIALEQLCMLLLMSDNVDRCFESCPPRTFLPALCRIFLDDCAPDNVLEVTARAITYYLDVSAECTRRIVTIDGAVKAICNRLAELESRTSRDLAEQCVKVLEYVCIREAGAVFEAGGLNCMLCFIREHGSLVHKDTLHSAMSVVSRLCTKIETHDLQLPEYVESLSTLLKHEDGNVADGALRCFASIADRFARKCIDLAPLVQNGLLDELLRRLAIAGSLNSSGIQTVPAKISLSTSQNAGTDLKPLPSSVSTVIGLLSTLCRGSAQVTHTLLRSNFPEAIEKAMKGDERCVLDTLRLVDLIMLLIFESRDTLTASSLYVSGSGPANQQMLRRIDNTSERTHRQLIDFIRSRDTDSFIEAIETGGLDVNVLDDVGQSLLNWASAFGTLEMIEYLCSRGADVNKGLRSSSLHYASCFGRADFVKTLLQYGANPDLRDEDGKTALDKARERNDEGHREVVSILQSPTEYLLSSNNAYSENKSSAQQTEKYEPKGDPEMAPVYLKKFLPIFCQTFQNTMLPSVRKFCFNFIKKIIQYIQPNLLIEICRPPCNYGTVIVEILGFTLDNESSYSWPKEELSRQAANISKKLRSKFIIFDDEQLDNEDGHLVALLIINELMTKAKDIFLDQFARFGIFSKVQNLALKKIDSGDECGDDLQSTSEAVTTDIIDNIIYSWHQWFLCRGKDCVYVWTHTGIISLELSYGSNGWFRFILDGNLSTMYSGGSPEPVSVDSPSHGEFFTKLYHVKEILNSSSHTRPLFSNSNVKEVKIVNWTFSCGDNDSLLIRNVEGTKQLITLKADDLSFLFQSNKKSLHSFVSHDVTNSDGVLDSKKTTKNKPKNNVLRLRVKTLSEEIYKKFFKESESQTRSVISTLGTLIEDIETCTKPNLCADWKQTLKSALSSLVDLLNDENIITAYELYSSGLIQVLLKLISCNNNGSNQSVMKHSNEKLKIFQQCFLNNNQNCLLILIKKLVTVLENVEKLPIYLYDGQSSAFGLQMLTRKLKLKLEKDEKDTFLIDRSERCFKAEPLSTLGQLERYLLKMVAKQWYDYDRPSFVFLKKLKDINYKVFRYHHDFDENGLMYFIGTNGKTYSDWINPSQHGLVYVTSSDGKNLPYGKVDDILSRENYALNCHTNDDRKAWFCIDLGVYLIPSCYTLRHARGYGRSALRNWQFQMSRDCQNWSTLYTHSGDLSLNEPGSVNTWWFAIPEDETEGWRYVRIQQIGRNASGQTYYLSVSGFEIYGEVTSVCEDISKSYIKDLESVVVAKQKKRLLRSHVLKLLPVGSRVIRGPDWKWSNQDGPGEGTVVVNDMNTGWVEVHWDTGVYNSYRMGAENKYDLRITTSSIRNVDISKIPAPVPKKLLTSDCNRYSNNRTASSSVLTSRKSSSTPSLPEATDSNKSCSVASTEQAASADNLAAKQAAEAIAESVLTAAHTEAMSSCTTSSTKNDDNNHLNLQTILESLILVESGSNSSSSSADSCSSSSSSSSGGGGGSGANNTTTSQLETVQKITPQKSSSPNPVTVIRRQKSYNDDRLSCINSTNEEDVKSLLEINKRRLFAAYSREFMDGCDKTLTGADLNVAQRTDNKLSSGTKSSLKDSSSDMVLNNNLKNMESTQLSLSNPDLSDLAENEKIGESDRKKDKDTHTSGSVKGVKEAKDFILARKAIDSAIDSIINNTNSKKKSKAISILTNKLNTKDKNDLIKNLLSRNNSNSVQGLVKLALSSNNLSTAQSYPSLSSSLVGNEPAKNLFLATGSTTKTGQSLLNQTFTEGLSSSAHSENDVLSWDSFLESCRGNNLTNDFEEDVDWNEDDDDDNDDNENEDDVDYEEVMVPRNYLTFVDELTDISMSRKKLWDEEYVLKGQFNALIPAFDPRPGRINVHQTTDVEVPKPGNDRDYLQIPSEPIVPEHETRLKLVLRGPNITGVPNTDIELIEPDCTLFKAVHELQMASQVGSKSEKMKRIWDSVYTVVYSEKTKENQTVSPKTQTEDTDLSPVIREILKLLRELFTLSIEKNRSSDSRKEIIEQFVSKKLTNKLLQQVQDPLMLSSNSLPKWCEELNEKFSFLFPFETRQVFFNCTAYGQSRSIVWLQTQRDAITDRQRPTSLPPRRDEPEYRIGRLKHERVKVPRDKDHLLKWAMEVMKLHANHKAILEVEFTDEEGTGLGPTLEFYALVAGELQRKDLCMWMCDDAFHHFNEAGDNFIDCGEHFDIYVYREGGLFPAPLPQQSAVCDRAVNYFWFFGVFIAKVLQDNRLVDIPLSDSFLKLLCHAKFQKELPCQGILTVDDMIEIDYLKANLLKNMQKLCAKIDEINSNDNLSDNLKQSFINGLKLNLNNIEISLEDLALTFTYSPSSNVFDYEYYELIENGSEIEVSVSNVHKYVETTLDFCLNRGIERQLAAFHQGFSIVFPMEKLNAFMPHEVKSMICGDQCPQWTIDDILNYTEPKLGYNKESAGFKRFVNVLVGMNAEERKAFLQFTTGCSSLPPGGLANLYPRLTIVRKVDAGEGSYPSVNTCVHYLKLPDYPSEELMRERLLAATKEKGFHLN